MSRQAQKKSPGFFVWFGSLLLALILPIVWLTNTHTHTDTVNITFKCTWTGYKKVQSVRSSVKKRQPTPAICACTCYKQQQQTAVDLEESICSQFQNFSLLKKRLSEDFCKTSVLVIRVYKRCIVCHSVFVFQVWIWMNEFGLHFGLGHILSFSVARMLIFNVRLAWCLVFCLLCDLWLISFSF